MSIDTQEEILKSIETGDFSGGQGLLTRDQQREYIVLLKRYSSIFGSVRTVVMGQSSMDVNKLHVGEPITVSVAENTNPAQDNKVKTNQVHLDARKTRAAYDITTEVLQQNIEGDEFELKVMRSMTARSATDLEYLAMLGDQSLAPAANDKLGNLLAGNDGWYKLAQGGHVLDLNGATLEQGIFSEMLRMLPPQYRGNPNLRFIVGETALLDYADYLSGRPTGLGDQSIAGPIPQTGPYGRRFLSCSIIPDDMPLTVAESVGAVIKGYGFGPFQVVAGVNDQLVLTVNGGAPLTITLVGDSPVGSVLDTVAVIQQINEALIVAGLRAYGVDDGYGRIVLKTIDKGAATSLAITVGGARDASELLGFSDGVPGTISNVGTDNAGTIREGSFIMLTDPRNLIWGVQDGTRMFTEFNKDYDRIETVLYNHTDAAIENLDALVLATNLRRRTHVPGSLS